jgi:hypothetical protein
MSQFEQWENIKFCQKLCKSPSETFQMIKLAYSKEALGRSSVFKWHKYSAQFHSLEDDEHTDRLRMVRTELGIQEAMLVHTNCSQMVDEVTATASGISCGTCHRILSDDLNMSCVAEHSVPCSQIQDQRYDRMSICDDVN